MRLSAGKHSDKVSGRAWWESPLLAPALMLLSTAPLWFASLPPLTDLLGHMGRFHVELEIGRSPLLQRNWAFHWAVIGNLGVDLLIVPLAHVFGLERATWLVALSLPPMLLWAVVRVCRTVHGRLTPFALACVPFVLAYPYQYGFVNYWLSCALALHAFASWVRCADIRQMHRAAIFVPTACLVWLAHAYGWAVLVVLTGAFELSRNWRRDPRAWPPMALAVLRRIWPVLVPAVIMLAWRGSAGGAGAHDFFNLGAKLNGFLRTFRDQDRALDLLSLAYASGMVAWGFLSRRNKVDPGLALAALISLALIVVMPRAIFGAVFADVRLFPIFFIAALAAVAPVDRTSRAASLVALSALLVFAVRIGVTAAGFLDYDQAYARHLQALDRLPRGASVAVLVRHPKCDGWRQQRLSHLGALAIVRRDAFENSQWDAAGAQLLTPLGARGTAFNADPSQYVLPEAGCHGDFGRALTQKIASIPRDRFGYVWLLGFEPPRAAPAQDLRLLYADDRSGLYALGRR
jgi:hypothetical protein